MKQNPAVPAKPKWFKVTSKAFGELFAKWETQIQVVYLNVDWLFWPNTIWPNTTGSCQCFHMLLSVAVIDERPKSPIEKRKRNLIFFSPISRRERETWNSFPQFREEKEKFGKGFSTLEKRKRKGFCFLKFREEKENFFNKSPISRREREIWNSFLQFWEEKEKFGKGFSTFETRKRSGYYFIKIREEKENSYQAFWKVFPFSNLLPIILWQPKL